MKCGNCKKEMSKIFYNPNEIYFGTDKYYYACKPCNEKIDNAIFKSFKKVVK